MDAVRIACLLIIFMSVVWAPVETNAVQDPLTDSETASHISDEFQGTAEAREVLAREGLVATGRQFREIYEPYTGLSEDTQTPRLITTDTVLHAYDVVLNAAVANFELEQSVRLERFSQRLLEQAQAADSELIAKIAAEALYRFGYQEYKPPERGSPVSESKFSQWVRDADGIWVLEPPASSDPPPDRPVMNAAERLTAYRQARLAYSRAGFSLAKEESVQLAIEIARLIVEDAELTELYRRLSEPYERLIGPCDDVDPFTLASLSELSGTDRTAELENLPLPQIPDLRSPIKTLRLFGRRRTPGALTLHSVEDVDSNMSPLDIFATGPFATDAGRRAVRTMMESTAEDIIGRSQENVSFIDELGVNKELDPEALRSEWAARTDAILHAGDNVTLGDAFPSLLAETLRLLEEPAPAAQPIFLSPTWEDKQLQTALAAWTEQRYLGIRELSSVATGDVPSPLSVPMRVAPYPQFFRSLEDLSRATQAMFSDLRRSAPPIPDDEEPLEAITWERVNRSFEDLAELCSMLADVAEIQQENLPLDPQYEAMLARFGQRLAGILFYEGDAWSSPQDQHPSYASVHRMSGYFGWRTIFSISSRPRELYVMIPVDGIPTLHVAAILAWRKLETHGEMGLASQEFVTEAMFDETGNVEAFVKSFQAPASTELILEQLRQGVRHVELERLDDRVIVDELLTQMEEDRFPDWAGGFLRERLSEEDLPRILPMLESLPDQRNRLWYLGAAGLDNVKCPPEVLALLNEASEFEMEQIRQFIITYSLVVPGERLAAKYASAKRSLIRETLLMIGAEQTGRHRGWLNLIIEPDELRPLDDATVELFCSALTAESVDVRIAATEAIRLADVRDERFRTPLLEGIASDSVSVSGACAMLAAEQGFESAADVILPRVLDAVEEACARHTCQDPFRPQYSSEWLRALGRLQYEPILPTLKSWMEPYEPLPNEWSDPFSRPIIGDERLTPIEESAAVNSVLYWSRPLIGAVLDIGNPPDRAMALLEIAADDSCSISVRMVALKMFGDCDGVDRGFLPATGSDEDVGTLTKLEPYFSPEVLQNLLSLIDDTTPNSRYENIFSRATIGNSALVCAVRRFSYQEGFYRARLSDEDRIMISRAYSDNLPEDVVPISPEQLYGEELLPLRDALIERLETLLDGDQDAWALEALAIVAPDRFSVDAYVAIALDDANSPNVREAALNLLTNYPYTQYMDDRAEPLGRSPSPETALQLLPILELDEKYADAKNTLVELFNGLLGHRDYDAVIQERQRRTRESLHSRLEELAKVSTNRAAQSMLHDLYDANAAWQDAPVSGWGFGSHEVMDDPFRM